MTLQKERRMQGLDYWLTAVAAAGAGVSAGVFFAFSFVVMPGLRELPASQGVAAMQALDRSAVTAPFMLTLYGVAALCLVLIVRAARNWGTGSGPWMLGAAVAFLLAAVVITGVANVPISASVDALDPSGAGAAARWDDLFTQWVWWNHVRTLTSVAATVGFLVALRPRGRAA